MRILPIVAILFIQAQAFSALIPTIHKQYVAPKALGMGDAYVAVADDYNTLYYNPAGLAKLPQWQLNMFLGAGADTGAPGFYNDFNAATKSKNPTTDVSNLVANSYGEHYHVRAPELGGIWVKPKWGFGIIPADLNIDMTMLQQVGPSINLQAIQDASIVLGHAWTWKWSGSDLSVGVTLKTIHRLFFEQALLAPQLALDRKILNLDSAREGITFDGDIGFLYSPDPHRGWLRFLGKHGRLGLVVRNVGAYGFPITTKLVNKNQPMAPPSLDRVVDVGVTFGLGSWWVFSPRIAIDHRDILHPYYNWRKGTHAGLDIPWKIRGWWRGGWRVGINQGYWTAGFSGTLGIFTLDLATYGEEVGTLSVPKEDRRVMARASFDI